MTSPAKISLNNQIEAVRLAETRQRALANGQSVKGLRGRAVEEFDLQRLNAAARSLEWLRENEAEIRAWVEARKAGGAA